MYEIQCITVLHLKQSIRKFHEWLPTGLRRALLLWSNFHWKPRPCEKKIENLTLWKWCQSYWIFDKGKNYGQDRFRRRPSEKKKQRLRWLPPIDPNATIRNTFTWIIDSKLCCFTVKKNQQHCQHSIFSVRQKKMLFLLSELLKFPTESFNL